MKYKDFGARQRDAKEPWTLASAKGRSDALAKIHSGLRHRKKFGGHPLIGRRSAYITTAPAYRLDKSFKPRCDLPAPDSGFVKHDRRRQQRRMKQVFGEFRACAKVPDTSAVSLLSGSGVTAQSHFGDDAESAEGADKKFACHSPRRS